MTLWARTATQSRFVPVANTTSGTDGSYSFPGQKPAHNTVYIVRTTQHPSRHSAQLFEGVADVVALSASSSTATVGGRATFTGTVLPDKSGHAVYLQRLGPDGDWHTVAVGHVGFGSTFQFSWVFGTPGTKQFRARVLGGPSNVGGHSAPVTIGVSLPPVSSLPPGS